VAAVGTLLPAGTIDYSSEQQMFSEADADVITAIAAKDHLQQGVSAKEMKMGRSLLNWCNHRS
jgi:hypothetical protein